jgi:hypothetical protein
LDTAAKFKHELYFPSCVLDSSSLSQYFGVTVPMEDISLVTWKCGSMDEETLLLLGANAITVIQSENMEDAFTHYMPLPRKLLKGLLGRCWGKKSLFSYFSAAS